LWSNLSSTELNAKDIFNNLSEINEPDLEASNDTNASEAIELTSDNLWSNLNLSSAELDVDNIFYDSSDNNSGIDDINELLEMIAEEQLPQDSISESSSENNLSSDSPPSPQRETNDSSIASTEDDDPTKTITAAIASIENIYDRLPNSVPADFAEPVATIPTPVQKVPASPATRKLTVKVDLDRLERMNNLVGELTINRNSLTLQNEQLQENVSELRQRFLRFSEITKKVMAISDRMLIEQGSNSSLGFNKPSFEYQTYSSEKIERATEFDPLEMDSYGVLHSSLQEVLEEIVQLDESVDDITIFAQQSDRTIEEQRQMLDRMRDELMWVRMLPLKQILQRFPRTLRDLSNDYQKPVELKLTGTDVLVDRAVLEKLSDPLLHLLRNSFDHGIEEPEVRLQQGKPATGSIEIRAYYQGNQTVIEVKDDGRGLDLARIAKRGIERGLISAQEASATPQRLFDLIFEPGFSTANRVSEISGRGVGMSIVRSQIETLKGKISVTSSPGEGSIFTMRLPLTLTIAKLLVCSLGATTFAIPSDSIEEIIIPTVEQIKFVRHQKFLSFNHQLIPIYCLNEVLQYNCPIPDSDYQPGKTVKPPEDWLAPILLIQRGQQLFALEVVSLLSEQELVIKPYGKAIAAPEYCYGCTILSDGSLIPIFNGSALLSTIVDERSLPVSRINSQQQEITTEVETQTIESLVSDRGDKVNSRHVIMIVDDSTAHRRTMALTLEKQGYRVIQCKDGKEALNGFKRYPNLNLIICDIEMPVMNGFEFLTVRRRDSALSRVPTFMLTSRSGAKHRQLAMQLGADGYFTKPYIEPEFVAEVNQILQNNSSSSHSHLKSTNLVRSKTILVIDDSSALRRTLASSLENKGYRVLQARDGAEGLELWRHNLQIDLVICDVEMPNMNGFEFLTMRRREPHLKDVPVIMLTSRNTDKHRTLATSLGATEFFTKPYVEERFLQDITQFIS
jgi:chemotaxis family two-component system sensor histidine kinase/response regulator PixL